MDAKRARVASSMNDADGNSGDDNEDWSKCDELRGLAATIEPFIHGLFDLPAHRLVDNAEAASGYLCWIASLLKI